MPGKPALSDHPPKQTATPRPKKTEQIAIVALRQVELLRAKDDVVQSKMSDAVQMQRLSQLTPLASLLRMRSLIEPIFALSGA